MSENLVLMTREEARAVVESIKSHVQQARALLLDLHEREGWKALGYETWEDCVTQEFGRSRSYMYRQLAAAKLELKVGSGIGQHPESHMRAINETLEDEGQMKEAYALAAGEGAESAAEYRRAAMEVWVKRNLPEGSTIAERVKWGAISIANAYMIGQYVVDESLPDSVRGAASLCSDPELAEMLVQVNLAMPELWAEIEATGCIPGIEEMVPIPDATANQLKAYLTIDSAEQRARYVEENREYYDQKTELAKEVMHLARIVAIMLKHDLCPHAKKAAEKLEHKLDEFDNL